MKNYRYDIAVSYASSETQYVNRVVKLLREDGLSVFYAPKEQTRLVGEDLLLELRHVYRDECLYVAAFISPNYLERDLPRREASIAIHRSEAEGRNCLIPICFQNAQIPGLDEDTAYLSGDRLTEVDVAQILMEKVLNMKQKTHAAEAGEISSADCRSKSDGITIKIVNAGTIIGSQIQCD